MQMLLWPMKLDENKSLTKIFRWIDFVEFAEIVENENFPLLRFRS